MRADRPRWFVPVVAVWVLMMGAGLGSLWAFANTPGPAAQERRTWPGDNRIPLSASGPTLVVFAHPRCPCSRATLGELAVLLAQTRDRVTTYVAFYRPADAPAGWEHTDLWDSAAAIPGVRVLSDPDGAQALAFGASVSGQALLYDSSGLLRFAGGITGARGHAGDNAGRSSLASAILDIGPLAPVRRASVFGCFLRSDPAVIGSPPPQQARFP